MMERDPFIPDLVSLAEAAEILGMGKTGAHRRAMLGQLRGAYVGNALVFRREEVEAQAKANAATKAP